MNLESEHRSVLLDEAIDALAIQSGGVYLDGTFGRGGHSRVILSHLGSGGRLIGLDRDPAAVETGKRISDSRFEMVHAAFSEIGAVLAQKKVAGLDGVLLDLGVSSPQLDDASRGLSFRFDAPLDMRMDTTRGVTAGEWLAEADQREIAGVIKHYGEERFASEIAKAIGAARSRGPITTTRQLAEIVAQTVRTREPGQHPATRTFQALRIHINQELEELSLTLPQCLAALRPGGRLVVISFHSLEDRIVKRFMRGQSKPDVPTRLPLREVDMPSVPLKIVGKPIKPSEVEVEVNPRARSAIMRVAEKM